MGKSRATSTGRESAGSAPGAESADGVAGPRVAKSTSEKARRAPVEVKATQLKNGAAEALAGGAPKAAPDLSNLEGVLSWLYKRADIERMVPGREAADLMKLDRMRDLLKELDDPHLAVKTVHVAGTKGKGSTCEMAASCLEACGYAVGVYTSPHLVDIRERIRINRQVVTPAEFVRLGQRVEEAVGRLDLTRYKDTPGGEPTFFELVTAMAFLHFAEQAVDIAVIEVGLGGRLDSTNVVSPEVTAITHISLDHTQILGATLESIAAEKAGIFKAGVPAVTCAQSPGVMEVLRRKAGEAGTTLAVVGQEIEFASRFESSAGKGPQVKVSLTTARNTYEHLTVPLKGEHQALNCGLALAILDRLSEKGFVCPETRVTAGLEAVELPGRMEVVWKRPRVVIDGAHNTESVRALIKSLGAYVPYDSLVMIFGCSADKDVEGMLHEVALGADKVIFTKVGGPVGTSRGAEPRELARKFAETRGLVAQTAPSLKEALELAQRAVGRDDLVCITGSFYLAGEAKKHFAELAKKRGGMG